MNYRMNDPEQRVYDYLYQKYGVWLCDIAPYCQKQALTGPQTALNLFEAELKQALPHNEEIRDLVIRPEFSYRNLAAHLLRAYNLEHAQPKRQDSDNFAGAITWEKLEQRIQMMKPEDKKRLVRLVVYGDGLISTHELSVNRFHETTEIQHADDRRYVPVIFGVGEMHFE